MMKHRKDNRMRKGLMIGLLLLALAFPLSAQEATPGVEACPGDLSAVTAALSADYESPQDALRALIAAREALLLAETNCARAGVVLLEQTYAAENGTFTLNYPNGWLPGFFSASETGGILFLGNTAAAQRALQSEQPPMQPGEMALQVLFGTPTDRQGSGLQSVVADFELVLRGVYPDASPTEYFTLDGRDAARFSFRGQTFDGYLVALSLADGRFVAIRGITSPGNLDALQAVANAVITSVR